MWLMVLFDLPTTTEETRKATTRFRNVLLKQGFERLQFSTYTRRCPGLVETVASEVRKALPPSGKVCMIAFTDLQYEGLAHFESGRPKVFENPKELVSF
jgi:CRISPR-associated protein Cas2